MYFSIFPIFLYFYVGLSSNKNEKVKSNNSFPQYAYKNFLFYRYLIPLLSCHLLIQDRYGAHLGIPSILSSQLHYIHLINIQQSVDTLELCCINYLAYKIYKDKVNTLCIIIVQTCLCFQQIWNILLANTLKIIVRNILSTYQPLQKYPE